MFERYTEQSRRAIYFARLEAAHRDEKFISVKDILLGLTWDGDSRAARAGCLKSRATELRGLLGTPLLPSTALPYRREIDIPLEDNAKKVLAYAALEANREQEFWLDTDHLLLGILRFSNEAASALTILGQNLQTARAAAAHDRRDHPPNPTPKWGTAKVSLGSTGLRYRSPRWCL